MSRRDRLLRVRHMLDHAREASEIAHGRSREDLDADRVLNLALVRLMEIVGEAASRISDDFRAAHPNVPWQDAADLRNRPIHGYDAVDLDILWAIIKDDLGPLVEQLETIIQKTDG